MIGPLQRTQQITEGSTLLCSGESGPGVLPQLLRESIQVSHTNNAGVELSLCVLIKLTNAENP